MPGSSERGRKAAWNAGSAIPSIRYVLHQESPLGEFRVRRQDDAPEPHPVSPFRNSRPFNPRELISSLTEELSPVAEDSGIELISGIDYTVPRNLSGDPELIRQILKTLLCRELQWRHGGWVGVEMTGLPSASGMNPVIRFSIQSAGLDFPPRPNAGDLHSGKFLWNALNGERNGPRLYQGSGLDAVRQLGGVLRQERSQKDWRRVYFDFCFLQSPETGAAQAGSGSEADERPVVSSVPLKLLLVQRPSFIRDSVEAILTTSGYRVSTAEGAVALMDSLEPGDPDMIILDAALPGGEAADILIRLRMDPVMFQARTTPVILLTAHAREEDARRLFGHEVESFVFKPVNSAELRRTVAATYEDMLRIRTGTRGGAECRHFTPADVSRIRMLFSSHMDLLREVAAVFPAEAGRHLLEMKEGIRHSDFLSIGRAAHCLISDTGMVGTCVTTERLRDIIEAGARGDLRRIQWVYPFLPDEILHIAGVLREAAEEC